MGSFYSPRILIELMNHQNKNILITLPAVCGGDSAKITVIENMF